MNRLATTLTVLAVVAGPPLLAAGWLQRHPWRPPSHDQVQAWTEQPMGAGTILAGCVTVVGLAWLLLIIYLVRRVLAELARWLRRARQLPVPTPAQMTASSMAGMAAFTLPAVTVGQPDTQPAVTDAPSHPVGNDHGEDHPVHDWQAGIALPGGGWIPYPTAAAVAALTTATWLSRRRHYRPDAQHPRAHDTDADLQPLPGTVHTITTALATLPAGRDPASSLPAQHVPAGILHLSGPGAAAAARGLLLTAALSAALTGTTPHIRVQPDDLPTLLPDSDPAGLTAAGLVTTSAPPPHEQAAPGRNEACDVVHACGGPANRADPPDSDLTTIVLTDEPAATHQWRVRADGIATGTGLARPRRLCSLDTHATADLLTLIVARHHPGPATPQEPSHANQPASAIPDPDTTSAAAHLTLLGDCHLTVAGRPINLRRSAGLQILAYLAVHPAGATRTELTQALWPHLPAATISQRLHTTLADLRKQLRPLLGQDPITRHDDRYQLNTSAITTDLQPWHHTVQTMTHAVGTTAQQRASRDLVNTYQGELGAGHNWPWLIPAREQIRRTVVDACSTLAQNAESAEALTWLQHAITIDPYNEPLHHQAADLLTAAGDHSGAAQLINNFRARLTPSKRTFPDEPGSH
nr:BTAD domain-containing putative transcriptional regulator [uncultured Actinoplanes sp.]